MRIGRLRHRIQVQSATETRDATGGTSRNWVLLATRWGSVEPIVGRERVLSAQVASDVTHRIRMREYAGLGPSMRLVKDAQIFALESVLDIRTLGAEYEIMARETTEGAEEAAVLNGDGTVVKTAAGQTVFTRR